MSKKIKTIKNAIKHMKGFTRTPKLSMLRKKRNAQSASINLVCGFTLIEILIALGIFTMSTLLITSSFLTLSSVQKQTKSAQEILNEFRFSIDLLGKELTSGSAFPDGCEDGCDNIIFATKVRPDVPLRRIEYALDTNTGIIMKGEQKTFGLCATIPLDLECYQPFTTDRVNVDLLNFFVNNKVVGSQVIITVAVQGTILTDGKTPERFEISSTYSPRLLQDPDALPPTDNEPPTVQIINPTSNDTYTTNAASLVLDGTSSDNVGVTEIRWRNEASGESGFGSSVSGAFDEWNTPAIDLVPSVVNTLVIEARDADGNVGTDTLTVNSTILIVPGTPTISTVRSSCSSSGSERMYIDWNSTSDADIYYVYRCEGASCTPDALIGNNTSSSYYDSSVSTGIHYRYRVRAYNNASGAYSDYSNTRGDTIDVCPPPIPSTPNISTVTSSCSSSGGERMYINWNSVTYATRYYVYRCEGASCTPDALIGSTSYSSYYDYSVSISTNYRYRVRAYNSYVDEYSDYSNTRGDTIDECTQCPPPWLGASDYCTVCGPCGEGEGDCDNDAECISGLYCDQQDGTDYCRDPATPPSSFSLSASPTIIRAGVTGSTTTRRNSDTSTITVIPSGGFNATVQFSASGGPTDIIYNFNPSGSKTSSTFGVSIPDNTTVGVYTISVSGSGGGENDSVNVFLDVFASGGGQQ